MLAGCGYRPLYSSSSESAGVAATMASVTIPEAEDRVGQLIRNDLISSMQAGKGEDKYTLLLKPVVKNSNIIDKPAAQRHPPGRSFWRSAMSWWTAPTARW